MRSINDRRGQGGAAASLDVSTASGPERRLEVAHKTLSMATSLAPSVGLYLWGPTLADVVGAATRRDKSIEGQLSSARKNLVTLGVSGVQIESNLSCCGKEMVPSGNQVTGLFRAALLTELFTLHSQLRNAPLGDRALQHSKCLRWRLQMLWSHLRLYFDREAKPATAKLVSTSAAGIPRGASQVSIATEEDEDEQAPRPVARSDLLARLKPQASGTL